MPINTFINRNGAKVGLLLGARLAVELDRLPPENRALRLICQAQIVSALDCLEGFRTFLKILATVIGNYECLPNPNTPTTRQQDVGVNDDYHPCHKFSLFVRCYEGTFEDIEALRVAGMKTHFVAGLLDRLHNCLINVSSFAPWSQ